MGSHCSKLGVAALLFLFTWSGAAAQNNTCEAGESPDLILADIPTVEFWGTVGDISSFSIGADVCNLGTCWLEWAGGTSQHPVLAQNMFRLADGRFEQIGQSWVKHGFAAFNSDLCSSNCLPPGESEPYLGVNCSDLYDAALNAGGLGPRSEVDPASGAFPWPPGTASCSDAICRRLQVHHDDIDPALHPGALYFVEGHYVAPDDALADNDNNNQSWAQVEIFGSPTLYNVFTRPTVPEEPAVRAWQFHDPGVDVHFVDVSGDGRFAVASRATLQTNGRWHYEYAVQNLSSFRAAGSFTVALPRTAAVESICFNDVDYHSGEPYDGTDWPASLTLGRDPSSIQWTTTSFATNPDANALRWGTLYNFRFDSDVPPVSGQVTLGLFRTGIPGEVSVTATVPDPCNGDGVCDAGEDCSNCPVDCDAQGGGGGCCGDTTCDPGETACSCEADCGPCVVTCGVDEDCDDGIFCNGAEVCDTGSCAPGFPVCGALLCDEFRDTCFQPCTGDAECGDGDFCNGSEVCCGQSCATAGIPCAQQLCDEPGDACFGCTDDAFCDDGLFCTGPEGCLADLCVSGDDPCPGEVCLEDTDVCVGCVSDADCDDGVFCNGPESCSIQGVCEPPTGPACPGLCDEAAARCLGPYLPQPRLGAAIDGLAPDEALRFELGELAFRRSFTAGEGLGPVHNGDSCAACHVGPGGEGDTTVEMFGFDDGAGGFDPLVAEGGPLLQGLASSPGCEETLPGSANVTASRRVATLAGLGLVEAVPDADLLLAESNPPPGVSGRGTQVFPLEDPAVPRVGRFDAKAGAATVLSAAADSARGQLGLTGSLLPVDDPPNGNAALAAACESVVDPEDTADPEGFEFVERVTDYLRFLAPPPQTPRASMNGEVWFTVAGCNKCHTPILSSGSGPGIEPALSGRTFRPYSDFLVHDMGVNADGIGTVGVETVEMRTPPLWGLRHRDTLWHDGRVSGGSFADRVREAIALHDAPGSEGQAAAQSFAGLAPLLQDRLIGFLDSLGRAEFDHDGDNDVDADDLVAHDACFTGPGNFYTADDPCAVSDFDRDGDVDDDDGAVLDFLLEAPAGAVPDGNSTPGNALRLSRAGDGTVTLSWDPSCAPGDDDFAIYEGTIGSFAVMASAVCSTGGATTWPFPPAAGDRFYLIVPNNGVREGGYGFDSGGNPRPAAAAACLPAATGACSP